MNCLYKKILFFSLILLSSCQREVPIEGTFDFEGAKIVVNAILTPSEIIQVHISKSTSPFVSTLAPDYNLSEANVKLYKNGSFVEQMAYLENGIYISPSALLPQSGESYYFKVSHDDLEMVETLPEEIPSLVSPTNYYVSEQDEILTIHFSLTDNPNEQNVYSYSVYGIKSNGERFWMRIGNLINDTGMHCHLLYEEGKQFSDECFNGTSLANFSMLIYDKGTYFTEDNISIGITLKHFSSSYNEYLSNQNDYYNYVPGFSDPPPLFSNVIGGYGAVLSYTGDEVFIEL